MAYIPRECSIQEYENQIYSGESKHRLYIKHGSTVIGTNGDENASPFASKLTWTRRILDNGKNSFSLDNFVSQEIELELHDYIIYNLDEEIEIKEFDKEELFALIRSGEMQDSKTVSAILAYYSFY